jgi:hypothetical protein
MSKNILIFVLCKKKKMAWGKKWLGEKNSIPVFYGL